MRSRSRLIHGTFPRLLKTALVWCPILWWMPSAQAQSFDHGTVRIEANTDSGAATRCVADARTAAGAGIEIPPSHAEAFRKPASASTPPATYRRRDVRFDAALSEAWALVEECGHPEKPLRALPLHLSRSELLDMHFPMALAPAQGGTSYIDAKGTAGTGIIALAGPPMVRAGDTVRLWQSGGIVRIELAAKAEQAGRPGDEIWLRSDAGGFTQRMKGVVRARGSVEMLP